MNCPRCGATMTGGICNSCGFPMNKKVPGGTQLQVYRDFLKKGGK